jgi:hypothetical protein
MKTTIELPDDLFAAAKAAALRRRTTLKALLTGALERELRGPGSDWSNPRFHVDEAGWPVLQRGDADKLVVTESFIKDLRESEGV